MSVALFSLIVCTLLTSLLAGVFFAYQVSVNKALGKLADREYIRAMQYINKVIENGAFFTVFMGPVVLLPVIAILYRATDDPLIFPLLVVAGVIYIVGSFILTIAGNVPLNTQLARFRTETSSEGETEAARHRYEQPWNRLHTIRTSASILSAFLLIIACVRL